MDHVHDKIDNPIFIMEEKSYYEVRKKDQLTSFNNHSTPTIKVMNENKKRRGSCIQVSGNIVDSTTDSSSSSCSSISSGNSTTTNTSNNSCVTHRSASYKNQHQQQQQGTTSLSNVVVMIPPSLSLSERKLHKMQLQHSRTNVSSNHHQQQHLKCIQFIIALLLLTATILNVYTSSKYSPDRAPRTLQYLTKKMQRPKGRTESNVRSSSKYLKGNLYQQESPDIDVIEQQKQMIDTIIYNSQDYITTQQRRLIVIATNIEYISFCDNFITSLLLLNITNYVIVPLDEQSYNKLQQTKLYAHHTLHIDFIFNKTTTTTAIHDDVSETTTTTFGSSAFRALTALRPKFLYYIMKTFHATIFYNDIDMVWKTNAWSNIDERIQYIEQQQNQQEQEQQSINNKRPSNAEIVPAVTITDRLTNDEMKIMKQEKQHRDRRSNSSYSNMIRQLTNDDKSNKKTMEHISYEDDITKVKKNTLSVSTLLWHDGPQFICTCLMYMKPTIQNEILLQNWEHEILIGNYVSDQDAFIAYIDKTNYISKSTQLTTYSIHSNIDTINDHNVSDESLSYVTVLYRNDAEFPHGKKYDWNDTATIITTNIAASDNKPSTHFYYNPKLAVIVHNNWIHGKDIKQQRFISSGLWNPSGLI